MVKRMKSGKYAMDFMAALVRDGFMDCSSCSCEIYNIIITSTFVSSNRDRVVRAGHSVQ